MVEEVFVPQYLKELPQHLITSWFEIYRDVNNVYGEKLAKLSADKYVLEKVMELNESEDELQKTIEIVPTPLDDYEYKKEEVVEEQTNNKLVFEVEGDRVFISRDKDGNDYIDLVLQDSLSKDKDGKTWDSALLKQFASDINANEKPVLADMDHEAFYKIVEENMDPEVIKEKVRSKPSIAKAVKAIFDKGRLWVRVLIDKRYRKVIENSKGVSLEAHTNSGDHKTEGELLGLSFMYKREAAKLGAGVVL